MSSPDPFLRAAAERRAQRAEEAFEFWAAARCYREAAQFAADPEQVAFDRLRWARALQKAENWRTQTAGWEELGNALGRALGAEPADRYRSTRQPRAVDFGVIDDTEWSNLAGDVTANRRQRQAWAYQWGAEVAVTHLEFAFAARLFRRAGVSWEKSEHTDKWRRAATCYYQAAMSAARTSRHYTRRGIHEKGWCPSCLREKGTEEDCRHQGAAATIDGGEGVGTDVRRLRHCWLKEMESAHGDPERRNCVLADGGRQISAIQTLLATTVSREDARAMFREGHAFRRDCLLALRRWPALWYARAGALAWRNGSSLGRLLCTIAVVFLVVIPTLWLVGGVITTHPKVPEAVLFSLANMVNTAGDHFPPSGTVTTYFQVLEALGGFIALGLALWVSQRSYA